MRFISVFSIMVLIASIACRADQPTTQPGQGKLPFITVDVKQKQIRVDCETIGCQAPLEFFCVVAGTSEHESILRSKAKPSNVHLALLMLGLEPGEPVKYSETAKKWFPPHGPPLNIYCEFLKDGKTVKIPAYRMMRDLHTKKTMPAMTWIFAGSRQMPDGSYAADATGYIVSTVNFELTLIDVPELASSANETLEWVADPDTVPKAGTAVTMIIEPAGAVIAPTTRPATQPSSPERANLNEPQGEQRLSAVTLDQRKIDELEKLWNQKVSPHDAALREAAQAQYEVVSQLRREQQRLIDEADRIQRIIDELEKKYQDMTTPRPEPLDQK